MERKGDKMNEELKLKLSKEIFNEEFNPSFLKFLEIEYCLDSEEIRELVDLAKLISE
jgi:hypothetical protein